MDRVYLDHAATTPVDPEVAEAMARVLRETHGNPSSIYAEGRAARAAVDRARDEVAAAISGEPSEIVFTSGGTEADNLALRGALKARRDERDGLVTSAIEHHAVTDTARDLERYAHVRVDIVGVDRYGVVDPEAIRDAIDERTSLVSVMHANNEIGTIQPIAEIGALCRDRGVKLHTDAVQTVGVLDFDVNEIPVDLVSVNAHKFYGPKGVGALYVRRGTRLATMQTGGGQEKGRRTGTENVALIVGLDLAGFAASSGSACTSGDTEPSHVLLALGLERHVAQGSLRLTVGRATTDADVDALLAALPPIVARLREASVVSV